MFLGASVKASPCQTSRSLPDSLSKYVSVSSFPLIILDMTFKESMGIYITLVALVVIPLPNARQLRFRVSWLHISTTQARINRASFPV
jgi:hypothetical protein